MFLESTTAPPPRKRRVAEGGPLPPRQCGSGRPAGLRARQKLVPDDLTRAPMVFVRRDGHVPPLQPLYNGPYTVSRQPAAFCVAKHRCYVSVLDLNHCIRHGQSLHPPRSITASATVNHCIRHVSVHCFQTIWSSTDNCFHSSSDLKDHLLITVSYRILVRTADWWQRMLKFFMGQFFG
jgi:hypothetical protein